MMSYITGKHILCIIQFLSFNSMKSRRNPNELDGFSESVKPYVTTMMRQIYEDTDKQEKIVKVCSNSEELKA